MYNGSVVTKLRSDGKAYTRDPWSHDGQDALSLLIFSSIIQKGVLTSSTLYIILFVLCVLIASYPGRPAFLVCPASFKLEYYVYVSGKKLLWGTTSPKWR